MVDATVSGIEHTRSVHLFVCLVLVAVGVVFFLVLFLTVVYGNDVVGRLLVVVIQVFLHFSSSLFFFFW